MKLREFPSSPGNVRAKSITGCKACCERNTENKHQIHCDLAELSLQMNQANLKRESSTEPLFDGAVLGWVARGRCLKGRLESRQGPWPHSNNRNEFEQAGYLGNPASLYASHCLCASEPAGTSREAQARLTVDDVERVTHAHHAAGRRRWKVRRAKERGRIA